MNEKAIHKIDELIKTVPPSFTFINSEHKKVKVYLTPDGWRSSFGTGLKREVIKLTDKEVLYAWGACLEQNKLSKN